MEQLISYSLYDHNLLECHEHELRCCALNMTKSNFYNSAQPYSRLSPPNSVKLTCAIYHSTPTNNIIINSKHPLNLSLLSL